MFHHHRVGVGPRSGLPRNDRPGTTAVPDGSVVVSRVRWIGEDRIMGDLEMVSYTTSRPRRHTDGLGESRTWVFPVPTRKKWVFPQSLPLPICKGSRAEAILGSNHLCFGWDWVNPATGEGRC